MKNLAKKIAGFVSVGVSCIFLAASINADQASHLEKLLSEEAFNEMFPNRNYYKKYRSYYPIYYDVTVNLNTGEVTYNTPGKNIDYDVITYEGLLKAAEKYPKFCNSGSDVTDKRELAAFLANASQETYQGPGLDDPYGPDAERYKWGLCITIEGGQLYPKHFQQQSKEYPPVGDRSYQGRGALQLTYNPIYGLFGEQTKNNKDIYLRNPDIVGFDPGLFWESAIWFWMLKEKGDDVEYWIKPSCHEAMTDYEADPVQTEKYGTKPGYGLTAICINGGVEGRKNLQRLEEELEKARKTGDAGKIQEAEENIRKLKLKALSRKTFYLVFCKKLGIEPGPEDTLDVFKMDPFPQKKK